LVFRQTEILCCNIYRFAVTGYYLDGLAGCQLVENVKIILLLSLILLKLNYQNMKKKLAAIAILCLPVFVFGQNNSAAKQDNPQISEPPQRTHQIGVNATRLIKELFSFNNNQLSTTNPYIITYKNIMGKGAFRFGVGGISSKVKTNPNNGQALSTSINKSVNLRVGYELRRYLSKNWRCYYGLDAVYNYNLSRFSSQTPPSGFPPTSKDISNNSENFSAGGGGVLGFEFFISSRVSFNVETQAYFLYGEDRSQEKNFFFTGSNSSSFSSVNSFQVVLPTALFFVVSL
jgi:hypothetical protein